MASTPTAPSPGAEEPLASKEEILACQFSSWYDTFRDMTTTTLNNKNCTIKSIVIPLPRLFIEYLLSDGVRLPDGATKLSSCAPAHEDDGWSSDEEDAGANADNNNDDDESEDDGEKRYSFPKLNEQISDAISSLGGAVIPKLNWSSPRDATWVNNGSMKCETPGDVYILLKSSDFVMHDILHSFDQVVPLNDCHADRKSESDVNYELVLRKWSNLHASQEFRCFVANDKLLAISQRNHTQYYQHLAREYMSIRSRICDFFYDTVLDRFASGAVKNYVFDCYVDKNGRVWLLDFNPFSTRTDALLFTWENLLKIAADAAEPNEGNSNDIAGEGEEEESKTEDIISCENTSPFMKVVETELEVHHDPIASYRAPIDTVDLMSDAAGDNSFQNFMEQCEKPSNM